MNRRLTLTTLAALVSGLACAPVLAQSQEVVVGVTISTTGPGASLGIPQKNTIEMLPKTLGGLPVKYVVYDDATDPTTATRNARRLIDEDKADVVIGSSTTPPSIAGEVGDGTKPALPNTGSANRPCASKPASWKPRKVVHVHAPAGGCRQKSGGGLGAGGAAHRLSSTSIALSRTPR